MKRIRVSPELKLLLVFLVPVAALLVFHYFMTGFVVYNDGREYFMYLRSAVIDHDINFTNEWAYYNSALSRFSAEPRGDSVYPPITKTGYVYNVHNIGNAIMWSPFFLSAHAASLLLNSAGLPVRTDGYGFLYEMSIGVASLVYGFLGIWLIYRFCRKWFERKTAFLATIAVWYGTAVFWYHSVEPSMSEMNSIFLIALFTTLWYNTLEKRTKPQWLMLGLLLGLLYLVRQQEILLGLLPAFEQLKKLLERAKLGMLRETLRKTAVAYALLGAGLFIIILPQLLVWKEMFGSYVVYTYGEATSLQMWYWTAPQLLPMFFSPEFGMWRVPVMLLSVVGLCLFAKRVKGIAWYLLAVALAQVVITSAWSGWWLGYGIRYVLGMSIFFALGAAELIVRFGNRFGSRVVYAAILLLIAANFVNMFAVMLGEITSRIPLSELPRLLIKAVL